METVVCARNKKKLWIWVDRKIVLSLPGFWVVMKDWL